MLWEDMLVKARNIQLPLDYLVFDVESTSPGDSCLPVEIGYVLVRDGIIQVAEKQVLNWEMYPHVSPNWLADEIRLVRAKFRNRGHVWHFDMDYMRKHGKQPMSVLRFFRELCVKNAKAGAAIVGHNIVGFDLPLLEKIFREALDDPYEWPPNLVYDTGLMIKSLVIQSYPKPEESLRKYFNRVRKAKANGVLWNLTDACQEKDLFKKLNISQSSTHDALTDCTLTRELFETQRCIQKEELVA